MKPKRILHVARNLNYGSAIVLDRLTRTMDRQRYEPIIVFDTTEASEIRKKLSDSDIKTINLKESRDEKILNSSKPIKKITVSELLASKYNRHVADIYLFFKSLKRFLVNQSTTVLPILKVLCDNKIDLVHTHSNLHHAKPEIVAALIKGIPFVSHSHAYIVPTKLEILFSKLVDSFIYISTDVADNYIKKGFPRIKSVTIHNGVEIREYRQNQSSDNLRQEFFIRPEEKVIGLVGRIDWWKGHDYFVEAFAEITKKVPGVRGLLIGEPSDDPINQQYFLNLKSRINELGLTEKIIFAGFRSDVPSLMAIMDIVVHASSQPEPFGLVVIEGMAARKPVVATAAGGVLDIIENGVNGMLVPCKDSKTMAKAILKILSEKSQSDIMGLAASKCVAEKFTITHQVAEVQKLYDMLLGL